MIFPGSNPEHHIQSAVQNPKHHIQSAVPGLNPEHQIQSAVPNPKHHIQSAVPNPVCLSGWHVGALPDGCIGGQRGGCNQLSQRKGRISQYSQAEMRTE